VGKAADWLREERRKVLGDWTAICLRCGAARRWFEEFEDEIPSTCETCGGKVIHRCRACGEELRDPELFGVRIRKPGR